MGDHNANHQTKESDVGGPVVFMIIVFAILILLVAGLWGPTVLDALSR